MNRSSNARSWWPALVRLGLPLQAAASTAGAAGQPLTVDPAGIEVGMFYDGTTVHISGQVPAGSEADGLGMGVRGSTGRCVGA